MVYGMNPTTIKVVWRYVQPSLEEEPLQGYKVCIIKYFQVSLYSNEDIIADKLNFF